MIIDSDKDQVDLRQRMGRDRLRLALQAYNLAQTKHELVLWHREGEWRIAPDAVLYNLIERWTPDGDPMILYWEQCRPIQSPTGLSI
jgi:hypothetical protein